MAQWTRPERETRVLKLLEALKEANQKRLAKELGISPQTLRPLLAHLEGQGMVESDDSMLPHRIWQLTDAGVRELGLRKSMASALDDERSTHGRRSSN